MNKTIAIAILISTMGLFSFLNKTDKDNPQVGVLILGMILLEEPNSLNMEGLISDLEENWKLEIESKDIGEEASVLSINGYNVAIGNLPISIPGDEVKTTAGFSYLWENAVDEAPKHKGHILLSIMDAGKNPVEENILFNQIAASILGNSKSIGIYIGGRTLLLKKDFYLANSSAMSESELPLFNWIYFGLQQAKGKQSIYTYGLADFGKKEMEIVNSKKSFKELTEVMYNLAHYVLAQDVTLKHGETIGMSAEQKLKISESNGRFLEGKTLKIKY